MPSCSTQAIAGRPKDMAVCIHLCRGNNQSAWVAEGGYEPVAEVLFNEIDVDGYFLEYDSPRAGDFAPLRFVPKGKIVVLGLVTTKLPQLETKDELKRRIDEAARYVPLEQLALSPQCGFSSVVEGNKITVDDEIAKLAPRRRGRARGLGLSRSATVSAVGPSTSAPRFAQDEEGLSLAERHDDQGPACCSRFRAPSRLNPLRTASNGRTASAARRTGRRARCPRRRGARTWSSTAREGVAALPREALGADDALAAALDADRTRGWRSSAGAASLAPAASRSIVSSMVGMVGASSVMRGRGSLRDRRVAWSSRRAISSRGKR